MFDRTKSIEYYRKELESQKRACPNVNERDLPAFRCLQQARINRLIKENKDAISHQTEMTFYS